MKYILTLFIFLFSLITYSQKIDGIGKFRIDKTTTSIIADIEKEIKVKCGITNELDFYSNKDEFAFKEILLDSSEIRLFYLTEYEIYDVKLLNIYLMFYNNRLIQFKCDKNKKLELMLVHKYGRPIIEQKTIPKINLNLVYDEYIYKYMWINNNIITISLEKNQKFNGIIRKVDYYFKIYDRTYINIIKNVVISES